MNRDVLGIIEQQLLRYNIANVNKRYYEKCYCVESGIFKFYFQNMTYNYRVYGNGKWGTLTIYDLRFKKIAELPKNY